MTTDRLRPCMDSCWRQSSSHFCPWQSSSWLSWQVLTLMSEPSQEPCERGLLHSHRSGPKSTCVDLSWAKFSDGGCVQSQHQDSQLLATLLISSVASMSIQLMLVDLNSAYCHCIQCENTQWQGKYALPLATNHPCSSNVAYKSLWQRNLSLHDKPKLKIWIKYGQICQSRPSHLKPSRRIQSTASWLTSIRALLHLLQDRDKETNLQIVLQNQSSDIKLPHKQCRGLT